MILLVISLEHIIDVEDGVDSILTSSPSITNSTISSSKSISSGTGATQSGSEQDYDNDINLLHLSESEGKILTFSLISIAVIVGLVLVANAQTFFRVIKSLMFSQRRHVQSAIAKLDVVKSEGYLQAVKGKSLLYLGSIYILLWEWGAENFPLLYAMKMSLRRTLTNI